MAGGIKQLAGQTVWYGISRIGSKLLNYLVTPLITYFISSEQGMAEMGIMSILYGYIGFMNIIFTYGFETAYFRYANKDGVSHPTLFQTTFTSHLLTTLGLILIVGLLRVPIGDFIGLDGHYEYIWFCLLIIGFDTLSTIPLAKLRKDERPKKYAFVNLSGIALYVILAVFFIAILPKTAANGGFLSDWYGRQTQVGLLLKANVAQAILVFLLLFKEWNVIRFKFDGHLWKQLWKYSWPLIIAGLAGMTNEMIDRQMLGKLLPGSKQDAEIQVAIYSYCYKLAIFITMFTQAFRLAAEPFFFNRSRDKNAPETYARVMKWFVITLAIAFLFTALFLDVWQYILGKNYREGLGVVPILLAANIFLGIYYNLSIWYKLTDKMRYGMYIMIIGSLITVVGNYYFIPIYGYYASAWATFACYFVMVVVCWAYGQKYYPIPYNIKRISLYAGVMLLLFFIHKGISNLTPSFVLRVSAGMVLFLSFFVFTIYKEKEEMVNLPFVGKYLKKVL